VRGRDGLEIATMLILLVEDEPLVRMLSADVLSDAGFDVVEAENADEAVGVLQREPDIAALVTDVDMPGSMDGLMLARLVHERFRGMPVLVVSGKVRPSPAELPPLASFIAKPYAPKVLISELRDLLAAA
jgi:two-component system, response regulator PdtaR